MGYLGLSRPLPGYNELSRLSSAICGNCWLSLAVYGYLWLSLSSIRAQVEAGESNFLLFESFIFFLLL